jgi:hypothetical protein
MVPTFYMITPPFAQKSATDEKNSVSPAFLPGAKEQIMTRQPYQPHTSWNV